MPAPHLLRKPEIMSPAGYWPQLHAAIEAGADSVYFGLKHFSARAKVGFSLAELPEAVRRLHRRGVRAYITFNTLTFEQELREAAEAIAAIAAAGADALIVQDVGVLRLAREVAPDMELHASTQMSITDARGVRVAQSMGVQRVTLARELSLDEVGAIIAETGCEIEIFVHGALCVAYSGQCFSSEAWGGRSANRGQCAQACRLPYELMVDGSFQPLGDARYLLSPGDLFALDYVPAMVEAGVAALKIEGRYKDAEYVALTTNAYRRAVDAAWENRPSPTSAEERLTLEQVYSRGLAPHFISGTNHQKVVEGRAPRHRGVRMGQVKSVGRNHVVVEPGEAHRIAPLKAGDGVVFDAADWRSPQEAEEGGRLYEVAPVLNGDLELRFGNGAIQSSRIRPGDIVWRTNDPSTERKARPFLQTSSPVQKQIVDVHLVARVGEPLKMEWILSRRPDIRVSVASAEPLVAAKNQGLAPDRVRAQIERLGNTAYELGRLDLETDGNAFLPASLLNQLRREAAEQLQQLEAQPKPVRIKNAGASLSRLLSTSSPAQTPVAARADIHVLVRTPEQLEAALLLAPRSITLDYLDLYGLRASVERVKKSGIAARVASPRVMKPGEARISDFLASLDCVILVRSAGLLQELSEKVTAGLIGDFSLNVANSLSARELLRFPLLRITPTHDLNAAQITELAANIGPERIEAVAYQHLPVFHTEHCVFCRFLSQGVSYRDCGRPCETHRIALRDEQGRQHPVLADVGCRNTVFGAEAQEASGHLDLWLEAGLRDFRLEFVQESSEQVRQVVTAFQRYLQGSSGSAELTARLRGTAPAGTTEGSLFIAKNYTALPVLQ